MSTTTNTPSRLTVKELLKAVPVQNHSVEHQTVGDNEILLRVPIRRQWYMQAPFSWIFPFRTHRQVVLDTLGREVWQACDGHRTIEEIIEHFSMRHHVSFHEARMSVVDFLKSLTQRGLVVVIGNEVKENTK